MTRVTGPVPDEMRQVSSGPEEQLADIVEQLLRTSEANDAFREIAADRAVRISELLQEARALRRDLHESQVAERAARRSSAQTKDDASRQLALHAAQVAALSKRARAAEREAARLLRSPLVRIAARIDAALRRLARALRRAARRG